MRKVAYNNKNEDVNGRLVIAYVQGTSERTQRIAIKYGQHTAFHSHNTLGKVLYNTAPKLSK